MAKTSRDLTEGNIYKQLIIVAWPILLSGYIQGLYNSADSIILGRFVGTNAVAAVAASESISSFIVMFFVGLSTGAGVVFSRAFGAKLYDKLNTAIHTGLLASFIAGIILSAIGVILSPALLRLVKCPDVVFDDALLYLRIYLIGVFFTSMYNIASGVLRAVGDSKTPTKVLLITSICNVTLNLISVLVLHMDVLGVALATIISQGVSVFLVIRRMVKTEDVYHLSFRALAIDWPILKEIAALGLPAAVQSCLISISNLFVQRYKNSFGEIAMAGASAGGKIDKFMNEISKTLGLSLSTFTAQNLGAKKADRAIKGVRAGLIADVIAVVFLGAVFYIFAEPLISLFLPDDPEAIEYGVRMMRTMEPWYFCHAFSQIYSNVNRGAGFSTQSMLMSIGGMIVFRQIYLNIIMSIDYRFENVYFAFVVGWFFAAAMQFIFYQKVTKKKMLQIQAEAESAA